MQVRRPAIDHVFHVTGLHHLICVLKRFANALAHHLGYDFVVATIEKYRFGGQIGFLVANAAGCTDCRRYQGCLLYTSPSPRD